MRAPWRSLLLGTIVLHGVVPAEAVGAGPPTLDGVTPVRQRVHDLVTLRGAGFGRFVPGVSAVVFAGAGLEVRADVPYVWRDDCIRVRVPAGTRVGGRVEPIPRSPLAVSIVAAGGASAAVPFRVLVVDEPALAFTQRTEVVEHLDVSGFLGPWQDNLARTKDAEIGDLDGDGDPDIIDSNSHNLTHGTHGVVRTNDSGTFSAQHLEPNDAADRGVFRTVIPPGGAYLENGVIYDADLVDLNNDGLPELVQTVHNNATQVRVLVNDEGGVPGLFREDTSSWIADPTYPGSPDDLAHADINADGFVDVAVAVRFTATTLVYVNRDGATFAAPLAVEGAGTVHDAFFLDADADGRYDLVLTSESSTATVFYGDGLTRPGFTAGVSIDFQGATGVAADLDGDGLSDIALAGSDEASVFLNDPDDPGSFTEVPLPDAAGWMYDLEAGDVNLDGAVDLIAAAVVHGSPDGVLVWINTGDGTFVNVTAPGTTTLLPGHGAYQRLSADLVDYDTDGDLDLYVTGADGQDVGFGFGRVANQFFENLVICPGDLNADGAIDVADLLLLLAAWGRCAGCPADLVPDDSVDTADFFELLALWGRCP